MTAPAPKTSIVDGPWNLMLGGQKMDTRDRYEIEDPATALVLAQVPACSTEEVDRIVQAAARAQQAWGTLPPRDRAARVRRLAAALREHSEELATLDAIDAGFPLPVMRADVEAAALLLELMADQALSLGGATYPLSGNLHYSVREPYGVVGRIVPFNHPLFFAAGKAAAPLVAGNSVVLKAPDQTPFSAIRFAELASDVLGPDLCAVITGRGGHSGRALVRHPLVPRIGFIGSPETGRMIQSEAAEVGVKNVTLELGGKNPLIVLPDADPAAAAESAVTGMNYTATAGQSCGSTSRLLVHESIAAEVTERVVEQVGSIRVGAPLSESTQMGPLIDRRQYERTLSAVEDAVSAGARVLTGGARPEEVGPQGYYFSPTVLGGMDSGNPASRREVFGPVLSVLTFRDEQEALAMANDTEFGLTAGIWTNDISKALTLASGVRTGYVWINGSSRHYWGMPFGGMKSSGVGREESVDELLSYTDTKSVTVVLE
ncbi:aldehyde dehydrogenase family protein [Nocardiopsis nanhaiensis]